MAEQMDWGLKKSQSSEELKAIRALADECWAEERSIKEEEKAIEGRKSALSRKLRTLQEILEAAQMDEFSGDDYKYVVKEEDNISGPRSEADWDLFKGWVKEHYPNSYDGFFKMHMGSLKAFVKREIERAEIEAEDAKKAGQEAKPFYIPGIPPVETFTRITSKAKKSTKRKKRADEECDDE